MQNATAFFHLYYSICTAPKALKIQLQLLLVDFVTLNTLFVFCSRVEGVIYSPTLCSNRNYYYSENPFF